MKVPYEPAAKSISNPDTLLAVNNNQYVVGVGTTTPSIGASGTSTRGNIVSGALEASNVDMATELTNLIVFQRGYQADSKAITAIDQMQQTAKAVLLFEVRNFEPTMREMGTLLVECAGLVGRALPLLQAIGPNVSLLTAITEELTKLEGRVDDLHDIGLKELFLKHRNANTMDFIVGAEIYDHLEKVADRFDDVANEISSIVIEQV